jgi:hypothetical protein
MSITPPPLSPPFNTSPTAAEIELHITLLNASAWKPDYPQTDEEIRARVKQADQCLQWFWGHGIPLVRNAERRMYRVWSEPITKRA